MTVKHQQLEKRKVKHGCKDSYKLHDVKTKAKRNDLKLKSEKKLN